MKKILVVCIGSLFLITLSGCSLGDIVDRFSDSEDTQIQDINPGSTRVYMDEIRGTLQYFTGNQLTLLSGSDNYVFDISQATLECSDGNPFFIIEIIVYRKECDWCYWWQDTASDDHRSCCFNGSVSDENKKQLDPFFDADRVRI